MTGLDAQDLVLLGSVIGGIIAAVQALVAVGDRLWKKQPDKELTAQSLQCGFQHKEIQTVLISHSEGLREMVKALRDFVETNKLQHQIVVDKLDRLHEALERKPIRRTKS